MTKLFKSFGYIDDGKNLNSKGIGLGLNISKQIVTILGGKIAVSSIYGLGTEFKFAIAINQSSHQGQRKVNNILKSLKDDEVQIGGVKLKFEWKPS